MSAADDPRALTSTVAYEATVPGTIASSGAEPSLSAAALVAMLPVFDATRYELRGQFGQGGLGVILRGFDRQLRREVAIKLLLDKSADALARFVREATITSRLQHPSIVPIYDVGRWTDGTPCYTMPLYPGRSLQLAIDARTTLAGRLGLLAHVLGVAEAIAHAHARRVLHRDIKPSNVLLGELGEAVVIDWGLAKAFDDDDEPAPGRAAESLPTDAHGTRLGTVLGTPAYMPPEQARGERADQRSDVYALGALLYYVVTGGPPFTGVTSGEVLARVLDGPPVDVEVRQPDSPEDLSAIVRKAMAREPAARYPDAEALARDLRRFLDGHLVDAHRYTIAERLVRTLRRHRALAIAGGLALVAVATVSLLSLRRVERERGVAHAAALEAARRADALVLSQAESWLDRDPTTAMAWLETYPEAGADWPHARALADAAIGRGVASAVLRRAGSDAYSLLAVGDGNVIATQDGPRMWRFYDLRSGAAKVGCMPSDSLGWPMRESPGAEVATVHEDGRVLAWRPDLDGFDLVAQVPGTRQATLSSDGHFAAWLTRDGRGYVIDRRTGVERELFELEPVDDVELMPRTSILFVRSKRGSAVAIDVATGELVWLGAPRVRSMFLSPYGRHVVLARADTMEWLDLSTGESRVLRAKQSFIRPVAFFPDGRVVISDPKQGVILWDPAQGRSESFPHLPKGFGVAASPDGKWIAAGGEGGVGVRQLETGDEHFFIGHASGEVLDLMFLPDGERLASLATDRTVRVWRLPGAGVDILRLTSDQDEPRFAVDPTGRTLVTSDGDGKLLAIDLTDTSRRRVLGETGSPGVELVLSGDGRTVVTAGDDGVVRRFSIDGGPGRVVAEGVPGISSLAISHDGQLLAAAAGWKRAWIWDLERGTGGPVGKPVSQELGAFVSPDGQSVLLTAAAGPDLGPALYARGEGAPRVLERQGPSSLVAFGFTPSGRYVIGGSAFGEVVRWDLVTGDVQRRTLHLGGASSALSIGDSLVLSTGADGAVKWWDVDLGLSGVVDAPGGSLTDLVLSPDDRHLAAIDEAGHTVLVWDLATRERHELRGHDAFVQHADFLPDGRVVSSSGDGTIRLWKPSWVPSESPLATRAWLQTVTSERLGAEATAPEVCR